MSLTHVYSQANFYEGKTVTLLAFTAPGGSGDLRVKAALPFLKKHIPGNPTVVIEYMDGGGGRKGANHLYHSVRPDGLTIGAASGAIVGLGIMREQGVTYDVDRFIYLGTPEHENHAVIYTRKELGLDNSGKAQDQARDQNRRSDRRPYFLRCRTAVRLFLGLEGSQVRRRLHFPEVDVALMNGELDARANSAISVLRRNPEWLDKGVMNFHAIMEVPKGDKHPRLSHLPEIESFAKTEREKKVLAVWRAFRGVGSPYILPPATPKDRVEILEEAMRKAFRDPEFTKYFKKLVDDDPSPLGAADLTKLIREMPRDAEILELLKRFSGAGPLPPRVVIEAFNSFTPSSTRAKASWD